MADQSVPTPEGDDAEVRQLVAKLNDIVVSGMKGYLDFARRMARPGISFTDEQLEVIRALVENSDIASAQSIILEELSDQLKD